MTTSTMTHGGSGVCQLSVVGPRFGSILSTPRSRDRRSGFEGTGSCILDNRFMSVLLFGPSEEPRQERLEAEEPAQGVEEVLPDQARPGVLRRRRDLALPGEEELEVGKPAAELV